MFAFLQSLKPRGRSETERRALAAGRRRAASPRAAVFLEFALLAPVMVMLISIMIEFASLWDAQVMANHAAWTVGRIAMVRGADGMVFSEKLNKWIDDKSEKIDDLPEFTKKALQPFAEFGNGLKNFNNRGNIATMFLMSTCSMGYYKQSTGTDIKELLNTYLKGPIDSMAEGVAPWIKESLLSATSNLVKKATEGAIGSLVGNLGGLSFLNDLVSKIADKVLTPVINAVVKPIASLLGNVIGFLTDQVLEPLGKKVDQLLSENRQARQLAMAIERVARVDDIVTVKDMSGLHFYFADPDRLDFPRVAAKGAKANGYTVEGITGWPPNNQVHAMVKVTVAWPLEANWLFPVVAGGVAGQESPRAIGTSLVLPQPKIVNENLLSQGAAAYDEGSFTNNAAKDAAELQRDASNYCACVWFAMKYRITEEEVSFHDTEPWYVPYSLKQIKPLVDILDDKNDYDQTWTDLCEKHSQNSVKRDIEKFFEQGSYHAKDYFHWLGGDRARSRYHFLYGDTIFQNHEDNPYLYCRFNDPAYHMINWAVVNKHPWPYSKEEWLALVRALDPANKAMEEGKERLTPEIWCVLRGDGADRDPWTLVRLEEGVAQKEDAFYHGLESLVGQVRRTADSIKQTLEKGSPASAPDEGGDFDPEQDADAQVKDAKARWDKQKEKINATYRQLDAVVNRLEHNADDYRKAAAAHDVLRKFELADLHSWTHNVFIGKESARVTSDGELRARGVGLKKYDIAEGVRDLDRKITILLADLAEAKRLEDIYGGLVDAKAAQSGSGGKSGGGSSLDGGGDSPPEGGSQGHWTDGDGADDDMAGEAWKLNADGWSRTK